MAAYNYLAHDDPAPPVARTVGQRLEACGYPVTAAGWGENIAYGYSDAASVMNGWLNSPGHRANIETAGYTTIGIGVARSSSGQLFWTQDFGTTGASSPPPSPPPPSGDTQAPTVPAGLSVSAGSATSLIATWQPSSDNVGVAGYGVYLNGSLVGSVVGAGANISGLTCGTSYSIAIDAVDAAGNRSAKTTGSGSTSACSTSTPSTPAPPTPTPSTPTPSTPTSPSRRVHQSQRL